MTTPDYFGSTPNFANSPLPTDYPVVTITGGGGSGATAYATIADGAISKITVTEAGNGYTSPPSVQISGGQGLGATAQAVLSGDYIGSIIVKKGGSGYQITGGMRKFVDSLPGIGVANKNNLGQYIPVAIPDTKSYPGCDYYEIELGEYTRQMHSDLPATKLRGYRQTNTNDPAVRVFQYLGPLIVAQKDRPVRVKFTNNLPTGAGGNLFLPVDTTVMGAGMGPLGMDVPPGMPMNYTQNRAGIHLHGGLMPWISDGTTHQWITPAGENTPYPKGASVQYVPDMPNPGAGSLTFYYTNQQSARFLFFHDHTYGITRLNFYAGEVGNYMISDPVEQQLITTGIVPADQIILDIQDKSFVPDNLQLQKQDPLWDKTVWGGKGNLWYPHVYMPNQNSYDITGANMMGRWDYGPWFWPPTFPTNGLVPNPYYDPVSAPWEPPMIPGFPDVSIVPESFLDTPVINGCAYPYLDVGRKAYRFRILNCSNERYLNLQLYFASSNKPMWNNDGTLNDADAGEVPMVPAIPNAGYPDTWPTDGRTGGVPNPMSSGPEFIQIGNEGGLLPAPAVLENTPIGYIYNRRDATVLNVSYKTLFLGPAERADVIIDFSRVPDGSKIILYNDSPAPVPGFDPRYDYYTGDPDMTDTGGAPTTQPGYGSNTRTLMQFRVSSAHGVSGPYDLSALKAALPAAYGKTQPPPIVPNEVYNAAFDQQGPADSYARIQDTSLSFFNGPLQGLELTNGGSGYTTAPTVAFTGGGSGAIALALIGGVTSITVTSGGAGYTSVPQVFISGGEGSGATAEASLTGIVSNLTIANPGIGYLSPPTIAITGSGNGAAATAFVSGGHIVSITVTNGGSGYTAPPTVTFTGGGGSGAAAVAVLTNIVNAITLTASGSGYTTAPSVTISEGGGSGAIALAAIAPDSVTGLTLINPGSYTSAPALSFVGGGGTGAAATAVGWNFNMNLKAIIEEFDPGYGRMNALLGLEIPNTLTMGQNSIPYTDIDPPTEIFKTDLGVIPYISSDAVQIWIITHNGVDTHVIHWHLFNVQLINRVGWDGAIIPPDPNEVGWKDTVRMNPLQNAIVAMRPVAPIVPFKTVNSIRPLDVTMPIGSTQGFANVDTLGEPAPVTNMPTNFGSEFMWHCHMLGHEENIMMRPMCCAFPPDAPGSLAGIAQLYGIKLTWIDNSVNETDWIVERALSNSGPWEEIASVPSQTGPDTGAKITYVDNTAVSGTTYWYRIKASNAVGYTQVYAPPTVGYPVVTNFSLPSPIISVTAQ